MVKQILLTATIVTCLGITSDLSAQTSVKQGTTLPSKANFKFLEDISVDPVAEEKQPEPVRMAVPNVKRDLIMAAKAGHDMNIEGVGAIQIKYSLLLDVEVELIKNINLFRLIEEWYGTRYVYGGATRKGIDCSALMQVFFTSLYGIALPRTARAQYDQCQQISRTELREGDLLFFNTTGGVSHVGMYLANNKFVHSSSSNGVTISDMFDPYYASRMIGAGRVPDEHRALQTEASPRP